MLVIAHIHGEIDILRLRNWKGFVFIFFFFFPLGVLDSNRTTVLNKRGRVQKFCNVTFVAFGLLVSEEFRQIPIRRNSRNHRIRRLRRCQNISFVRELLEK